MRSPGTEARTTLITTALVLVVLAAWFASAAYRTREVASQSTAYVDLAATQDVTNQVSDTITKAFSYDYTRSVETESVARHRLDGQALAEYERLFGQVRQQGGAQKLVLTTKVKSTGVMSMQGDQARLLVFADQLAVRAGTDQQNVGPAQLEVTARRDDGSWKITEISLL
jgi:Mce-associated membrane protein